MKLIRTNVKYYDNALATPMLICLPAGSFMIALGFGINSGICVIIGIILLILFLILKIANWAVAKNQQSQAIDDVKSKIKDVYNSLLRQGINPLTARLSIAKDLQKHYESGEIDVSVYNKLFDYVMKEM